MRERWRWGVLLRLASFWIGVHYSQKTLRYCINLVPCVTLWIAKPGGEAPQGVDFEGNVLLQSDPRL